MQNTSLVRLEVFGVRSKPSCVRAFDYRWVLLGLVLLVMGLIYPSAYASKLPVQRIEQSPFSNQKLSGIIDILQDSQGFLWLATETGLLRFDGLNTLKFDAQKNNPNSLSNQYCWSLLEDRFGKIWIATENGLNEFDPAHKTFKRYLHDPANPNSLSHNFSTKVIEIDNGEIYVATAGGVTKISADRQNIVSYRAEQGHDFILSNRVRTVMQDSEGYLWLGYEDAGATRWHPQTGQFQHFHAHTSAHQQPGAMELVYHDVRAIVEDDEGFFWLGTFGGGVTRLDLRSGIATDFAPSESGTGLPSGVVWDVMTDHEGRVWVAMDKGGVARYNPYQSNFDQFRHDPFDEKTLLSDTVKVIYQDQQRNYWFAHFPGGLSRYHVSRNQFSNWYHRINDPNSLSDDAVLSVARSDDGLLWVGTENGLNRIDEASGAITRYVHDPNDPHSLPNAAVLSIAEAPDGAIWVGTWGQGLAKLDRNSGRFERFEIGEGQHALKSPYVWKVLFDEQANVWLATETDGLNFYDAASQTFERFVHSKSDQNSISFNYVWDLERSHDGTLWIGTQHGLNRFNTQTRRFERFAELDTFEGLGNARVHAVLEDRDGFVWVATQSSGLKRWDPQTETIVSLTQESGLPSNTVSSLQQDELGYIWASTVQGIVKVDPKQVAVIAVLTQYNGIAGDNHNRNASLKSEDGAFYFGSTKGLTKFYPTQLELPDFEPKVTLTNIYIVNKSANVGESDSPLSEDISQTHSLALDYDANVVSFEFSSLDYGRAGKLKFAYRLEGLDTVWNIVQNHNQATYTNLNPGNYVFKVRRQKPTGDWSKQITELDIKVQAPPWLSPAAYLAYGFALVAVIWVIVRLVVLRVINTRLNYQVAKRTEELSRANSAKTQFLANMSHELRTPLNSIIGFSKRLMLKYDSQIDERGLHALDAIHRNGEHLLSLINDILDLSKIESGKMELHLSPCNLQEIIGHCIADLQQSAAQKSLSIVPPSHYGVQVVLADAQRLTQILYNLLSNAIKYTDKGHVAVVVDEHSENTQRYCTIAVIDTGRGIKKEDQEKLFSRFERLDSATRHITGFGTGLGLALVAEFASMHGGRVECQSTFGQGSQFTLYLPQPTLGLENSPVR